MRTPLSLLLPQLCSKNALGATPFMTAVSHRNYAAALRILDYVQQRMPEPIEGRGEGDKTFSFTAPSCKRPADGAPRSEASDGSPTGADLLSGAILAPMGGGGVTPLQALFSGFSSNFDLVSMCLHVTGFPLGYTAQQLLRLFQTRYPSVYKAQVFKNGDSEDSSSSENSSSEEEEEEEEGEGEGEGGETEPRVHSREDMAASVRRRMFLQRRSTGWMYKCACMCMCATLLCLYTCVEVWTVGPSLNPIVMATLRSSKPRASLSFESRASHSLQRGCMHAFRQQVQRKPTNEIRLLKLWPGI